MDANQVMLSIQRRRRAFDQYREDFRWAMMPEVVTLKWLTKGKPASFAIPSYENWGRLNCEAYTDPEEGLVYIKVKATYKAVEQEVDPQDVMFNLFELEEE